MLRINNIHKKVNNIEILSNITFKVKPGESIGIIGPHNSGKSTLMNILAGASMPTLGNVEFEYQNIFGLNFIKCRNQIGYAAQYFTFYPHMKVYEYLDYVCILKDILDEKARQLEVERLLELFNIQNLRNKVICNLTRSNKQKINLCQALVGNPKILLFDEPTLGLEPEQAIETRKLLKNISKDQIVIVASHILPEVTDICSDLLVLDKGKVLANESTKKISKDYCQRNILTITTEGDPETIRYSFSSYKEVLDVSIEELENKRFSLILELEKDTDIRKDVFQKLSSLHMPIHKMQLEPLTLEELFSRLEIYKEMPEKKTKVIDIKTKRIKNTKEEANEK